MLIYSSLLSKQHEVWASKRVGQRNSTATDTDTEQAVFKFETLITRKIETVTLASRMIQFCANFYFKKCMCMFYQNWTSKRIKEGKNYIKHNGSFTIILSHCLHLDLQHSASAGEEFCCTIIIIHHKSWMNCNMTIQTADIVKIMHLM